MTEILQSEPGRVAPTEAARTESTRGSGRARGVGATTSVDRVPGWTRPVAGHPGVALRRPRSRRVDPALRLHAAAADRRRRRTAAGLGDPIDLAEVDAIYRPISRLLDLHIEATRGLHAASSTFLREDVGGTPFVIGVAGSVAVGKSTTARLLRELLARWPATPRVQLITTDGFLYPNAELERRGLMERKGFPESYDRRALLRFVSKVKAGAPRSGCPCTTT